MKTPDEIKKGMQCHIEDGECMGCPYTNLPAGRCSGTLCKDALAYIQQLEKRIIHLESLNQSNLSTITMQERTRARLMEDISQLEAQVPKWISVEERLPEGECLAGCFAPGSYGYGEYIIGYVAPYSESEGSGYCAENSFVVLDDITHWMPLPEPPEEEDK